MWKLKIRHDVDWLKDEDGKLFADFDDRNLSLVRAYASRFRCTVVGHTVQTALGTIVADVTYEHVPSVVRHKKGKADA